MPKISYQKLPRWKYRLVADYSVRLPELSARYVIPFSNGFYTYADGILVVRAGYCWDGASGVTVDTHDSMRASLVHDVLYQAIRDGLLNSKYRKQADEILWRILLEDGMCKFRAHYWYFAVRKFAPMFGALSKVDKTVHTAP